MRSKVFIGPVDSTGEIGAQMLQDVSDFSKSHEVSAKSISMGVHEHTGMVMLCYDAKHDPKSVDVQVCAIGRLSSGAAAIEARMDALLEEHPDIICQGIEINASGEIDVLTMHEK